MERQLSKANRARRSLLRKVVVPLMVIDGAVNGAARVMTATFRQRRRRTTSALQSF